MHNLLHVTILTSTIFGAVSLALLLLWPLIFDVPLPRATRAIAGGSVALAGVLFLLEWQVVH